jgi:FkbM family methyltransferase
MALQVFGAGRFGRDLAQAWQARGETVLGFLTSGVPTVAALDGLPVRQASAVTLAASPVAIGVFNREAHSDYRSLAASLRALAPGVELLWPQAGFERLQPALGERFWLADPARIAAQASDIAAARALFDPLSHATFDALIAFRQHAFDAPPPPDAGLQYLPDWLATELAPRGPLRLVDGGAYRGETLTALAARLPLAQAWSFEPDPENHAALVAALADWPVPATHIPAGLSDRCGLADFQAGAGEASHFGGSGGRPTPVVSLDACLHLAPVNFIKLDVEGQELAVLAGARRTLQRERPTLAIAAYHRWDDLWRLPLFLAELGLGYRLRLGLHGHNSFDTVLYAY